MLARPRLATWLGIMTLATLCAVSAKAQNQLIFADGFESGDTSAWSKHRNPNAVDVNQDNPFGGNSSLEVMSGNGRGWVQDNTPKREDDYLAEFHINPGDLELRRGRKLEILRVIGGGKHLRLSLVQIKKNRFEVRLRVRQNNGKYRKVSTGAVRRNDWTKVSVLWVRAGTNGLNRGYTGLFIDNRLQGERTDLDNDIFEIDKVRFGLPGSAKVATFGSYYLDDFSSFRTLAP